MVEKIVKAPKLADPVKATIDIASREMIVDRKSVV